MEQARAEGVVAALRERGIFAHLARQGVYQMGVRVVIPDGREAVWDSDGTASLEAQVMRDGILVGYIPKIPGSADFDEAQVVEAIAAADYDAPLGQPEPARPSGTRAGKPAAPAARRTPPAAAGRGLLYRLRATLRPRS